MTLQLPKVCEQPGLVGILANCPRLWYFQLAWTMLLVPMLPAPTPNQVAFLRVARWLSFLLALGFIFAVPLIVVDSHKLMADSSSKLQEIQANRIDKIHQLEQKVDKVTNPAQMKILAQQIQLDNNSFTGMSFTDIKDKLKNGLNKFAKQNEKALMIEQEKKAAVIRKKAIYNIVNCLILFAAFLRIGSKIGSVGIEKNYYNT